MNPFGVILIAIGIFILATAGGGKVSVKVENQYTEPPMKYELCKLNDFYGPRCAYYRQEGLAR